MAFGRIIELDVGRNNNTGLRVSNLNISFETERSTNFEGNYGNFIIYNARKETRQKVLIKNNNLILRCGYKDEDNLAMVFFGIIIEASTRKEGANQITEVLTRDFGSNTNVVIKSKKSFQYSAGTLMSSVVVDMANLIAVPIIGQENIADIVLNNGFTFVGSITNALRKLNKIAGINNIGIYFDQGEMVIYKKREQDTHFGVVNISPKSGLLGEVEEIIDDIEEKEKNEASKTIKTVSFASLLNPKLKPNTVVNIKSEKVNGAFIVTKVRNVGDNMGGTFVSEVEAIE